MAQLSGPSADPVPLRRVSHEEEESSADEGLIDTALFEQMEESVAVFRPDATYLYLNLATERLLNKKRQELMGRVIWEVLPETAGGIFQQAFLRVAEMGQKEEFEYLFEPWDRWFRNRMYRSGERIYVFSRETTEERLRTDALLLHAWILESMTEGVALTDESGSIVYTNPALDRMFGYGRDELLGQPLGFLSASSPEENRRFMAEFMAHLKTMGSWEGELLHSTKGRTSFITAVRISTLPIGGKVHWLCVHKDVTEQRRIEVERANAYKFTEQLYDQTRLAEQRAAFLALASEVLSSSLDRKEILTRLAHLAVPTLGDWCAVHEATPEGQILQVAVVHLRPERVAQAHAFYEKYPFSLDEPGGIGKVLRTGTTEFIPELTPLLIEEGVSDLEHRRDILELGIESVLSVPLVSRGRTLAALTLVYGDSHRRYTEADVRLAEDLARRAATSLDNGLLYKEAQDAIRARDSFLSIASHELNTPLTSLSLNVQTLQRMLLQAGLDSPQQDTFNTRLQAVQRQIRRLANLIHEMLDVSRITAGKLRLEPEEVDLAGLARDLTLRFSEELSRSGGELRLETPESVVGVWDRLRVEQILQNLLTNAIKYGRGLPIEVRVSADAQWARMMVRDQGIGISAEDQARLFQRFERLASERHFSGFGLGLWIVRQILDAMGGRILLESEAGRGSTFTVELPLRGAPLLR
ncbi:MAG TPA: ATP-binding protein [Hyalangium sp.]|jgi:PAS domain S-box-containing protein|nr:ATP-binding protein [Hyalangium sp.]